MNTKKILMIIGFVIIVIALGALIYFVFIRDLVSPGGNNENVNGANQNTNGGLPIINTVTNGNQNFGVNVNFSTNTVPLTNVNTGQLDDIARGGLTNTSTTVNTSVIAAEPEAGGGLGVRYYDQNQGKFYVIDRNGTVRELSDQVFPQAKEIAWSPRENKAVITFPDQSNILYDFDKRQQVTLPQEWDGIEFSATGDKIGFKNISNNESERWLAVSKPDGSAVQLIEPIGDKSADVAVNWSPNEQVVAMFRRSTSADGQEVILLGQHDENFKSIETDGRNFEGKWSPTGEVLLYTVQNAASRYNPTLHIVDASGDATGGNDISIGLQTWVDRCTFSRKTSSVYCAVPSFLETGSGFYPETVEKTNDSIYKIDINSGTKSILALPSFFGGERDYAISSVFIANDEQYLYFRDNISGQLFQIQLK